MLLTSHVDVQLFCESKTPFVPRKSSVQLVEVADGATVSIQCKLEVQQHNVELDVRLVTIVFL